MGRASQIVILCEDKAHEIFVSRFLKKGWKIDPRVFRTIPFPSGKGSGKKFVEDNLAKEYRSCCSRHAVTILIVVRDADEQSVAKVKTILDAKLDNARCSDRPIVYVIPKWHIETWVAYLAGRDIDENDRDTYKNNFGSIARSREVHQFIDKLADCCSKRKELDSPPDSLVAACNEFDYIRDILKQNLR